MAADDRYSFEDPRFTGKGGRRDDGDAGMPVSVDPPPRGCMRSCLTGCLWIGIVLIIVGGILAFVVYKNWRKWAANIGSDAIKQSLEASDLPAAEKAEIGVEVDRLAAAFREEKISLEQAAEIVRQIAESPLATSLIVSVVDTKYLASSGLSDEEKEAGRKTLRRFARGVIDNKIPEADRDTTLQHMAVKKADGNWELKERVTDDELRAFLAAAQANSDAAQIVEEPEVIDPSDELRRIVDEALGAAAPPPAAAEPEIPVGQDAAPVEPAVQPAP
jgi:hypothetical protein